MGEYKEIEGQCGTCKFADAFDSGPSLSGPEDGVHCTSMEHAKSIDGEKQNYSQQELAEYGFTHLFRIECLAGEDFRCPHWEPSEAWQTSQKP